MKLFRSARTLLALLLMGPLAVALAACGGGGSADTMAPAVSLNPLPVKILERSRALSGTVDLGATVEILADPSMTTKPTIGPVTQVNGIWSCNVDLVPGLNTLHVKATDATGNNFSLVFGQTYEVVTLDLLLPTTMQADQTLRGTLATGATLSATLDGTALAAPVPNGNDWSLALTGLAAGAHTLVLEGTDTASPEPQKTTLNQTITVDSSVPAVTVDPLAVSPLTSNSVTLGGTVVDGATVSLTVPTGVVAATVVQAAGRWSCDLSNLTPGRNQIDITATDANGKQGTARLVVLYTPVI